MNSMQSHAANPPKTNDSFAISISPTTKIDPEALKISGFDLFQNSKTLKRKVKAKSCACPVILITYRICSHALLMVSDKVKSDGGDEDTKA